MKIIVFSILFLSFSTGVFAYDSGSVFCVSDFGNDEVNGTYVYEPVNTWSSKLTFGNGNNGFLAGSTDTFADWSVIIYPATPPSGNFTDQQAYLGGAGGLSGWTVDSGNGNTSPAGGGSLWA